MREEEAKKKMPMASESDQENESVGLRVGPLAWKWPPVYPYDDELFLLPDAEPPIINPLAAATGESVEDTDEDRIKREEKSRVAVGEFWKTEPDTKEFLSDASVNNLRNHLAFYLKEGDDVLEFGAGEDSYFPKGLKLGSHVGVAYTADKMKLNPSITELITADLNDVEEERGVRSEDVKGLGQGRFDKIVMTNTVDFLTRPREVFRTAWFLLKPGGTMIVPFSSRDAYKPAFEKVQTKMWRTMNDDQHMWVAGSFFQFSAGDGWEGLKGFDISPPKPNNFIQEKLDKTTSMYVVQATKASLSSTIDPNDPTSFFSSSLWLTPVMESRDKMLIAPRLGRAWEKANEEGRKHIEGNTEVLVKIYESLVKMDSFAFPFNLQAQLATDLMSDMDFDGNDLQITNLRMGLGLSPPNDSFWGPVGKLTGAMVPEDKVSLLAHIVPRFGKNGEEGERRLQDFVSGLEPTCSALRRKCGGMDEGDVQLAATELLAAEVMRVGRGGGKEEFARFVTAMSKEDVEGVLERRKGYKREAEEEMKKMVKEREEERKRAEEEREKMMKQMEEARENRTMRFNPETGAFEEVEGSEGE
ncbi:hypothetical protein TrCOL_g256 [Triparma columacea]|nr:hypothetical protein TrCOL_g256 [Triparma columacea]